MRVVRGGYHCSVTVVRGGYHCSVRVVRGGYLCSLRVVRGEYRQQSHDRYISRYRGHDTIYIAIYIDSK